MNTNCPLPVDHVYDSVATRMAALPLVPGFPGPLPEQRSPLALLRCIQRKRSPSKRRPPFAVVAYEVADPADDCNLIELLVHPGLPHTACYPARSPSRGLRS